MYRTVVGELKVTVGGKTFKTMLDFIMIDVRKKEYMTHRKY